MNADTVFLLEMIKFVAPESVFSDSVIISCTNNLNEVSLEHVNHLSLPGLPLIFYPLQSNRRIDNCIVFRMDNI